LAEAGISGGAKIRFSVDAMASRISTVSKMMRASETESHRFAEMNSGVAAMRDSNAASARSNSVRLAL